MLVGPQEIEMSLSDEEQQDRRPIDDPRSEEGKAFLRQLWHRLWLFASRETQHHQDAEDAVQTAQLALVSKFEQFHGKPRSEIRRWMYAVVLKNCQQARRDRSRKCASGLPSIELSVQLTPDKEAVSNEAMKVYAAALAALPEDQRVAIILLGEGRMSYRDIAEIMGLPVTNVTNLIYRAKNRLEVEIQSRSPDLADEIARRKTKRGD
jgi:RNA polymerase sigma-70 factor (ECF subfamily)